MSCVKTNPELNQKLALIYNGPGVSQTDSGYLGNAVCWDSIAISAGYKTKFIYQNDDISLYLNKNTIWVHPGGDVTEMVDSISPRLRQQIIDFVAAGGGFVGSCAGGFIAGEQIIARDTTGIYSYKGFGLIPDTVFDKYDLVVESKWGAYNLFLQTNWLNYGLVDLYWWWGPYFTSKNLAAPNTTILAYYPNSNQVLSFQTFYKKGPVILTGVHPEATIDWYKEFLIFPTQPIQYSKTHQVARSMLSWAFENNHYGE